MTSGTRDALQRVRIVLARVHQAIGWAGMAGLALFIVAAAVASLAWSAQRAWLDAQGAREGTVVRASMAVPVPAAPTASTVAVDMPRETDIPLLLTQMKQAAVANGLEWRAADYRVTPATPAKPSSLEVRCSLRGPYPNLRSMLVQLIGSVPAFAIREFSAARPNADTPDIEAKLVLAVFLQDATAGPTAPTKGSP